MMLGTRQQKKTKVLASQEQKRTCKGKGGRRRIQGCGGNGKQFSADRQWCNAVYRKTKVKLKSQKVW